jgi:hypothetical protein
VLSLVPEDYEIRHRSSLIFLYGIVLVLDCSTVTLTRESALDQTDAVSEFAHEVDRASGCQLAARRCLPRRRQLECEVQVYLSSGIIIVLYGGNASLRTLHWSRTHGLGRRVVVTDRSGSDREVELVELDEWLGICEVIGFIPVFIAPVLSIVASKALLILVGNLACWLARTSTTSTLRQGQL